MIGAQEPVEFVIGVGPPMKREDSKPFAPPARAAPWQDSEVSGELFGKSFRGCLAGSAGSRGDLQKAFQGHVRQ